MEARGERVGGIQTHKRMVASLEKQIAVQEKKLEQVSCLTRFNKITIQIISFSLIYNSDLKLLKVGLAYQSFLPFSQVQEKHNKLQETMSEAEEQLSQVITKRHIFSRIIVDLLSEGGRTGQERAEEKCKMLTLSFIKRSNTFKNKNPKCHLTNI